MNEPTLIGMYQVSIACEIQCTDYANVLKWRSTLFGDPRFFMTEKRAERRIAELEYFLNKADRESKEFRKANTAMPWIGKIKKGSATFSLHEIKDGSFIGTQERIVKAWVPNSTTMCF